MKGTVLNPIDSDVKTIRINVATYAGRKSVVVVITHDLDKNYAIYCAAPLEGYPIKGLNLSPTVYVETGVYLVTFSRPDGPDEDAEIDSYILTALDLFLKRVSDTVTHHATCNVLISGLMPSLLDLLLRIGRGSSSDFMAYINKAGIANFREVCTMLNAYVDLINSHFTYSRRLIPPSAEEIDCAGFQAGLYADSDAELIGGKN